MEIGATLDDATTRRIRDSFGRQGLMAHLGVQMVDIRAGLVMLRLPFLAELSQHHGYFHAGASSALADTAGGYAAHTLFPAENSVLTVEFKLNLINPARGGCLEATGRVVKPGRTLTVCQLDVWAVEAERRTHCATGLQTLIRVAGGA